MGFLDVSLYKPTSAKNQQNLEHEVMIQSCFILFSQIFHKERKSLHC